MSKNLVIDLGGKELNHFKIAFLMEIGKARHLTRLEALAKVILELKPSKCS